MGAQPAESATLVLFHPIGNNARTWRFLGLEGVVTPEYPGHGDAAREPGWTHEGFVDRVMASIPGRVDVIGMSMGGVMVAQALARHPEKVRSAVICCAGSVARGAFTREEDETYRRMMRSRGRRGLEGGMESMVDETLSRWFTPAALARPHAGVAFARQALLDLSPAAWNDIWMASAETQGIRPERFASFTQPITVLAGMHDWAAGVHSLRAVHEMVPVSRLEVLTGPHMMQLEQPENLRAAIDRHFAWVPHARKLEQPIVTIGHTAISIAQEGRRSS